MREKTSEGEGNSNSQERDRETMQGALTTMSVEQLRTVRSTILRLKHLPFTKLTQVLFSEPVASQWDVMTSARVQEDHSAPTYGVHSRHVSEMNRTLLEDVETILKAKEQATAQ